MVYRAPPTAGWRGPMGRMAATPETPVPKPSALPFSAEARRPFLAMATSYVLGTFNDNFFKQAVMLLAVTQGRKELQGLAALAFTLPFVLLAAPAGWMADRFPKRSVVVGAKALETLAGLVGLAGLVTGHLELMVGMVGLMGLQATFFSPALNGSIPELHPAEEVPKVNALLRVGVSTAILVGVTGAGLVLDIKGPGLLGAPRGQALVGIVTVALSLLGLAVSFGIPRREPADPARPFPWSGPGDTWRELRVIAADRLLGRILAADVFIWAAGVYQLLVINTLGKEQLGLSDAGTSLLVAAQLVGLALGGLLAARWAKGSAWFQVLVPAGLAMALAAGGLAALPLLPGAARLGAAFLLVGTTGAAGGLYLIPCESFLQVRPAPERRGAVWAAANSASFAGMALASIAYLPLRTLPPNLAYGVLGAAALGFTLWLRVEFRHPAWRV